MFALLSIALRSLRARRVRSTLTIVGVALGVGMVVASLTASLGIDGAVERTVAAMIGRADLRVAAFQERGLSDTTIQAIRTTPGIEAAVPSLERRLYLRRDDSGIALSDPVMIRGIDPALDPLVHDLRILNGSGLSAPDAPTALITERLARREGLGIGSRLTLQTAGDPVVVEVVGIVATGGAADAADERTVVVPLSVVQSVLGLDGVGQVDIRLAPGTSQDAVVSELARRITVDPYVLSVPADLAASLRASTAEFQATLAMIAVISLFVGAFLVFNTLSLTVVERSREVGLLRAAGATHGQILVFVLVGALVLGLAGSVLGLVVGAGLGALVGVGIQLTGTAPFAVPDVPPEIAAIAIAVGTVTALAGGLEPAWRATRISPIEAVRLRADPTGARQARLRWLLVVIPAVALVGLVVWPGGTDDLASLRALAVYGILVLATLLSPLLITPLARIVGLPFALFARLDERLARGSLSRDRSRTTLTLGALAVGLATIVAIGGVAQQARLAASAWLTSVVPGDEVATSIRPIGLDEEIGGLLAAVPGVERVTPVATFDLAYRGVRLDGAAVVGSDLLADGRLTFVQGDRDSALRALDDGGAVILARSTADRLGLSVGSVMPFTATGGSRPELRVVGVVERSLPGRTGESLMVGWSDASEAFGVTGADFFGVRYQPGQMPVAQSQLEATARSLALEPASLDRVQGAVQDALARVFGLFDALALVAVLIAALGIVNTLSMSVLERVRELGILRATGMTGRQVARMVMIEAGILGLVGSLIGIGTGLAAGAAMLGLGSGLRLEYEPPWLIMGLATLLGLLVSMAAAYYPARLAGRLSIVRAVQTD
jgi:putative ABC transport system permease protein